MLRLPRTCARRHDVSSLKLAIHAAAPCPVEVKRQMLDWWGPVIHEYYSGTEGVGLTWVTPEEWLEKPGTVGKSIVGVPHIVGPDGEELPVGQDGAVYFSDGRRSSTTTTPTRRRRSPNDTRLADVRRHRPRRRGRLPVPDRSRVVHDHLGWGQRLPAGDRGRPPGPPQGRRRGGVRVPHPEMGEVVHAVVQPVRCRRRATRRAALEAELVAHCARASGVAQAPAHDRAARRAAAHRDRQAAQAPAEGRVRPASA